MDVLKEIAKYPVFTVETVEKLTGNTKTAYSTLGRYSKKGYIKKIRNNIYSPVDLTTGEIIANRYQIACATSKDAYISHHSALEYYGLTNQVMNEVYVTSNKRFNSFEFEGIRYKYIAPKIDEGVKKAVNTFGIRLTDLERTVLDSINDVNKITGIDELKMVLDNIDYLNEETLKQYLKQYSAKPLYQKVGYLLGLHQNKLQLSDCFFEFCKTKMNKSITYLVNESVYEYKYQSKWRLMVPKIELSEDDEVV